ncbi:hypothetical protein F0344_12155 [Streptomyces finlayi]|uniref:Lipoprotein n=1 Tax=Streptomyces finlayi TaxID=67296 RepID=A0A7G7BIU7_9ACTN|nr:hypothetical protein [Streptomyces finlayi]QNE75262.1 hypothetical protein F0344_12155 [Streptomyces finlayi]
MSTLTNRLIAGTAVLTLGLLTTGCGDESATGAVPEGWGKLTTPAVSVARPAAFEEESGAERGQYNAAAARLTEDGTTVGTITVQLDFTRADTAEEAAIGAEAGVALGARLKKQSDVEVHGPQAVRHAKRVDFTFTSGGDAGTPAKGTRVAGVIITGLDSQKKTYAVRIDAAEGRLSASDLDRIIESITVK